MESDPRFRILFDRAAVGMAFVALDGHFTHVNERLCTIVGYDAPELLATTCHAITHPDDRAFEAAQRTALLAGGETRTSSWEKRFVRRDGTDAWCSLTLTVLVDAAGMPTEFVGIVDDIAERKRSDAKLAETLSLLNIAGRTAQLGAWAIDLETERITWSDEACAIFDVEPGSVPSRADVRAFYLPQSRATLVRAIERSLAEGVPYDLELQIVSAKGVARWIRVIGEPELERGRMVGAVQDITERKSSEVELVRMNRALKMLSGCNELLVRATDERRLLDDVARLVIDVGGYAMAWAGYAHDDAEKSIEPIAVAGQRGDYLERASLRWDERHPLGNGCAGRVVRSGSVAIIEDVERDPTFAPWRELAVTEGYRSVIGLPLRDETRTFGVLCLYAGNVGRPPQAELDLLLELADDVAYGIGHMRTQQRRMLAEREISYLAFHDALTDLPNRAALVGRLATSLGTQVGYGALLFIDLDNFKTLNDTLGHHMGDRLLNGVARRLQACVAPHTVARLGGDEFVIMLEAIGTTLAAATERARAVADDVLSAFDAPFDLVGQRHVSTPSVGVALYDASDNVDEILKSADLAMYQAKGAGRNAVRFFDPSVATAIAERGALEADLRAALAADELRLAFQPQVDVAGGTIGAEVLVRWTHRERGEVDPARFIAVAENSGSIVTLGRFVLRGACERLVAWSTVPHLRDLDISVNVSPQEFRRAEFVRNTLETIRETGADPHRLTLELTETVLADGVEMLVAKMTALREIGVSFSLDDFGTGYSSLSYLKTLPLRQLKIDRSFVRDVLVDPGDAAIARTIVALGNSLNLEVIAEGVETSDQFRFLADAGCRSFQGFYFGAAVAADAFEKRLETRSDVGTGAPV